jgi:DNA-binding response OmpR family regulator
MPKLMLVEDDRTMLSLLTTLLEMQGYQIVTALGKEAVLQAARRERPDLVLMDVFLAEGDGVELLSALRGEDDLAQVKVIMTSGMDLEDRVREAGADGFLLKPYTPEQLIRMIETNLGGNPSDATAA